MIFNHRSKPVYQQLIELCSLWPRGLNMRTVNMSRYN